jgi:hypothetical protein
VYSLGGHSYGLGPRICHLSTTYGHALGSSGCVGFFACIVNLCATLPWIDFRLTLVVNAFGCLGHLSATISATFSAFSSWCLQNCQLLCAIFHNFLSTTDYSLYSNFKFIYNQQERDQVHHTVQVWWHGEQVDCIM